MCISLIMRDETRVHLKHEYDHSHPHHHPDSEHGQAGGGGEGQVVASLMGAWDIRTNGTDPVLRKKIYFHIDHIVSCFGGKVYTYLVLRGPHQTLMPSLECLNLPT